MHLNYRFVMLIDRIDVYLEGIHVERIESHSLLLSLFDEQ